MPEAPEAHFFSSVSVHGHFSAIRFWIFSVMILKEWVRLVISLQPSGLIRALSNSPFCTFFHRLFQFLYRFCDLTRKPQRQKQRKDSKAKCDQQIEKLDFGTILINSETSETPTTDQPVLSDLNTEYS